MTGDLDSALAPPGQTQGQTAVTEEQRPGPETGSVPSPERLLGAAERVMRRVRHTDTGCMIWLGAFNSAGTAVVGVGRQAVAITRVMWFAKYGEMPAEKLERTCGDTRCVSVDHLRPAIKFSDEDKFWRHVDVNGPVHPHDATGGRCWDWTGKRFPSGYGLVNVGAVSRYAHRLSLLLATGHPLTPGMHVMHSCDRPCCVNPAHLREGTPAENVADRDERFYGRKKAS